MDFVKEIGKESRESLGRAKKYWERLGPGLTTGAADDDPSGIATYSQAGAQTGFRLLWLAPLTFPLMAVIQEMCARIGLVTGRGLAANIRMHYPRAVLYGSTALLFAANTFNVAVDLGAMAAVTRLLFPRAGYLFLIFAFTAISLALQIFLPYRKYAKYLKYLALFLFSYVASAFLVGLDWGEVVRRAVIPSLEFSKKELLLVAAVLGTTISPYLFFWQTSQEVEEEILAGKNTIAKREAVSLPEIRDMRRDVWTGMFVSNLVMFFIIAACAGTLYAHGITDIRTAEEAALALAPFGGRYALILFALGIIGTGLLSLPILAGGAAYAIAESFRWKEGLSRTLKHAHAFYGVLALSMALGMALNFFRLDPMKGLLYSAVANGIIAPVILFLVVRISDDKNIMGEHANKPLVSSLGWNITRLMALISIVTLYSLTF